MRLTVFAATLAFLLWGTPAFAGTEPDFDNDGIGDQIDNCSIHANTGQDDTDGDDCGNICDANYTNSGLVGFNDYVLFSGYYGKTNREQGCHFEVIPGCKVGFNDFIYFAGVYLTQPGPSGTTAGTTACP
jgi:hypothetical protein